MAVSMSMAFFGMTLVAGIWWMCILSALAAIVCGHKADDLLNKLAALAMVGEEEFFS
jgi:hypothetical protein